jgi:hypothetical protein
VAAAGQGVGRLPASATPFHLRQWCASLRSAALHLSIRKALIRVQSSTPRGGPSLITSPRRALPPRPQLSSRALRAELLPQCAAFPRATRALSAWRTQRAVSPPRNCLPPWLRAVRAPKGFRTKNLSRAARGPPRSKNLPRNARGTPRAWQTPPPRNLSSPARARHRRAALCASPCHHAVPPRERPLRVGAFPQCLGAAVRKRVPSSSCASSA